MKNLSHERLFIKMSFLKHFNSFQNAFNYKKIGYTIFKVFLDNPYLINSFQHVPNVPTIN